MHLNLNVLNNLYSVVTLHVYPRVMKNKIKWRENIRKNILCICAHQQRRTRGEHKLLRTCKGVWRRSMPCRCLCSWLNRRKSNSASVWSVFRITKCYKWK